MTTNLYPHRLGIAAGYLTSQHGLIEIGAIGIGNSFGGDEEAVLMLLGAMLLVWGIWQISTILFTE